MTTVAEFVAAEKAHTDVLSAGYKKDAPEDAKNAMRAAKINRGEALGISGAKAGIRLISPRGDLQMAVTSNEVADAKRIVAGEPLTWSKDSTRGETPAKAGDPREASPTSKFLAAQSGALVNDITKATGLDAITFKEGNRHAVAYMDPAKLTCSYDDLKVVTDHTRGTTCAIEKRKREALSKGKDEKGAGMEA